MMNTNPPSKDRKNVQYQSPGKLLITSQAAGYIPETTAVFNSKDKDTPGNNDLFVVDRIHQSLESTVSPIGQLAHPITIHSALILPEPPSTSEECTTQHHNLGIEEIPASPTCPRCTLVCYICQQKIPRQSVEHASSQRTLHRIPRVLFDSKYKDWERTTGPVPTCRYKQLTVTCVTDSAESSNKYTPTYHKRKDLCQSIHNTSESHRPQTDYLQSVVRAIRARVH